MSNKYRNKHTFKKGHKGYKAWLGKKRTEETKMKISKALKGRKLSEETKLKMSIARKGKPQPWNIGRKHTKEWKEIMSKRMSGKNHHNWRGGISILNDRHDSRKYKEWRMAVYKRDDFTCQRCDKRKARGNGIILNAHHVKSFAEYSEVRYEISNGITLCDKCHYYIENG